MIFIRLLVRFVSFRLAGFSGIISRRETSNSGCGVSIKSLDIFFAPVFQSTLRAIIFNGCTFRSTCDVAGSPPLTRAVDPLIIRCLSYSMS